MKTVEVYVRWIVESMGYKLSDEQIKRISNYLINSKSYNEMLNELGIVVRYEEQLTKTLLNSGKNELEIFGIDNRKN